MTEIKSIYKAAWAPETALGNNGNGAFTALQAGDTAYLIGDYVQPHQITIESVQNPFYLASSHDFDALSKEQLKIDLDIPFLLMDGIPLYYALGVTSDGSDGNLKTHALSGKTPSQTLPSFTYHYEATDVDSTSTIYKDILGCRVNELILTAARFKPVECKILGLGLDIVDSVALSEDPVLKATAVDQAYHFGDGTFTWNSSSQNHIKAFTMRIKNNLKRTYVNRTTTYYRAKYLESWERVIAWSVVLNLKNKTWIDEIKAAAARTFTIDFQRDANEYTDDNLTITLNNSSVFTAPLQFMPFDENEYTLSGIAKTCTVAIRDLIASY